MMLQGGGKLRVGPGQITDDSEMAMCLLKAAYLDT
jgi:ADP-ribosylglycohydrolase